MPRNTNDRSLVWVKVSAALPDLKYGFQSGMDTGSRSALGQTPVTDALYNQGLVVGANAPKPSRASRKRTGSGYEGSFCSYDVIATLKQAGWSITPGKPTRKPRPANGLSKCVYVTMPGGVKYAWYSPIGQNAPTLGTIGVRDATGSDNDLIFGSEFPKPPRYKKLLTDGSSFSSFVDPTNVDAAVSDGWFPSDDGNYAQSDLARYL